MTGNEIDPLTFPGFRLVRELGAGANGAVWRARELESQRLVALKVYRPEILRRAGFVSGLDSAVLRARSFKHPAAAEVYGLVEAKKGGRLALLMELVGGEALDRALQRNVRFSVKRALRLARDLADALAAAGAAGLVAGALHPGHVVVSGESAKLLGLGWSPVEGLAAEYRHAPEEGVFAPAAYAAPEVLSGGRPDARSDVFALGAALYHMLTGLVPFRARTLAELKLERTEGLRWPRGADSLISSEVIGLVGRALELDPAFRPEAGDLAAAAGRVLSGRGGARRGSAGDAPSAGPEITASAQMPPAEPGAAAPPAPARGGAGRARDMLLGALAAAALIAAGLALGRLVWYRPEGSITKPPPPVGGAEEAETGKGQPPAPPAEDPVRREWEAVLAVLDEKPAGLGPIKKRLEELATEHRDTQWGLRAQMKLGEIVEAERRERLALYRDLVRRAEALEREGKFGAAAALFESPPKKLAGTELAVRCAEGAAAVRKRAAERFKALSARAERSVADGDLAAAILDYQQAADGFGIDELVARAGKRIAELGQMQEEIAARSEREKEEARRARAAKELVRGLGAARAQVQGFAYAEALAGLNKLSADPGQPREARGLLADYAALVLEEQKLFKRASRRVAGGVKELTVSKGGSQTLTVEKLDETGLTASGTGGVSGLLFRWKDIPAAQIYRAFKLTVDVTSAEEHLALATLAYHHGQRVEMENGLKLAVELGILKRDPRDPQAPPKNLAEERARRQAEVYAGLEALLNIRRAGAGEADAPRRRRRQ